MVLAVVFSDSLSLSEGDRPADEFGSRDRGSNNIGNGGLCDRLLRRRQRR